MASEKANALLEYINEDGYDERIELSSEDGDYISLTDGTVYLVVTEDEAREYLKEEIMETFSYFNSSFLSSFTGLPERLFQDGLELSQGEVQEIFDATNTNIDDFASEAEAADGLGHFLARYDGNEIELGDFLAFRTE